MNGPIRGAFQEEQAGDEWYSPRSDVPAGHDGW